MDCIFHNQNSTILKIIHGHVYCLCRFILLLVAIDFTINALDDIQQYKTNSKRNNVEILISGKLPATFDLNINRTLSLAAIKLLFTRLIIRIKVF